MAKKQNKENATEQAKRFEKAVRDMIDAGELSPTEAEERFEQVMRRISLDQDDK
ncbi:hypothetical protein [Histidinibacterium lentulum]|uniref:hypothetical protein n=1 Tax=Histidinibacterium lentulum TaxID=2480588 RepID=UPI00160C7794|nr:hypothetical protein [Histidinibacterium lentulum]